MKHIKWIILYDLISRVKVFSENDFIEDLSVYFKENLCFIFILLIFVLFIILGKVQTDSWPMNSYLLSNETAGYRAVHSCTRAFEI